MSTPLEVEAEERAPELSMPLARRLRGYGWVLRPVGLFVASRVVVLCGLAIAFAGKQGFMASQLVGPWPTPPAGRIEVRASAVWDGAWYAFIAGHGYTTALNPPTATSPSVAFFPLFPMIIHAVAVVIGSSVLVAGVLSVFAIGAAASVAVWLVARELCGVAVADRACALWCFLPGAYVLTLLYSEGLTTLLAAICLLALLRRWWWLAGVAAGLATGNSPDAVVLVVCCLWAAAVAIWQRREWAALAAPLLAPAGVVGYFWYLWARTGNLFDWFKVEHTIWQAGHGVELWLTTFGAIHDAIASPADLTSVLVAGGFVVAVVLVILLLRWRPPAIIIIYGIGAIIIPLLSGPVGDRPRFFLVAFPLVIALVRVVRGTAFAALLGASAVVLGMLTVVTFAGVPVVAP